MYPQYLMPNIKAALVDTPVVFIMGPRQYGARTLFFTIFSDPVI
jgi:hypothetical protein